MSAFLEVNNLTTQFNTPEGVVHAVNGISFELQEGEVLGIVGESGCGKSVTMLSLMGLLPSPPAVVQADSTSFLDKDLLKASLEEIRKIRGAQISMVFQDPMTSLNPVLTVGTQLQEPLELHLKMNSKQSQKRAVELLEMVGIPEAASRLDDYPYQFSGGMRQRVMIAMALACSPKILIADEPTTALDVTIQAQIVELVKDIRQKLGMSIIWITHDLGIIAGLADRVLVMYAGYVVEQAAVMDLYLEPQHPYTQGLLGSLPRVDADINQDLVNIEGMPPNLINLPKGCPFADRCSYTFDRCLEENPTLTSVNKTHQVACWWNINGGAPRHG